MFRLRHLLIKFSKHGKTMILHVEYLNIAWLLFSFLGPMLNALGSRDIFKLGLCSLQLRNAEKVLLGYFFSVLVNDACD